MERRSSCDQTLTSQSEPTTAKFISDVYDVFSPPNCRVSCSSSLSVLVASSAAASAAGGDDSCVSCSGESSDAVSLSVSVIKNSPRLVCVCCYFHLRIYVHVVTHICSHAHTQLRTYAVTHI